MKWRTQANARRYRETQAERRRGAAKALHHELEASERQEDARHKEAEVLKTSLIMAEGIVMYRRMRKLTQHIEQSGVMEVLQSAVEQTQQAAEERQQTEEQREKEVKPVRMRLEKFRQKEEERRRAEEETQEAYDKY